MKKIMTMLVALGVVGVAGCATYTDLVNRPADYAAQSPKTPEEFMQCALPAWVHIRPSAHLVHDGDALRIIVPVGGLSHHDVLLMLVAQQNESVTTIMMKHSPSFGQFRDAWRAAKACT